MFKWIGSFWNSLIYPEYCTDEIEDPEANISWVLKKVLKGKFPDFVVCISVDDYDNMTPDKRKEIISKVKKHVQRSFPKDQCKLLGFAHSNSIYFCGNISESPTLKSYSSGQNEIYQKLHLLQDFLRRKLDIVISIGLAFLSEYSIEGWRFASQRAVVAQRYKLKRGRGCISVYPRDMLLPELEDYSDLDNLIIELYNSVYMMDVYRIEKSTEAILRKLFEERYIPLGKLKPTIQIFIGTVVSASIRTGLKFSEILPDIQSYLTEIDTTYDYARLKELLRNVVSSITIGICKTKKSNSCGIVEKAKQFISSHLSENISLKVIAQELNVNPSYLSRRFKEQEGINITDYIHFERIKEAQRLLLDENYKISTIAFTLGYGSIQNFTRVFKKLQGCSPKEYRKSKLVNFK
ncbi:helix-turn-helix transcriptional regulator [bacterium]|nr:helix-turn-helix transcriptional regulator [bacterium]